MRIFCSSVNKRFRVWFQYFLPVVENCLSDKLIFLVHFPRMIKFKIPHKTEHLFIHKNPCPFIHASWMNISSELYFTRKKLWKVINVYMSFLRDMLQWFSDSVKYELQSLISESLNDFCSHCKADLCTEYSFLVLVSAITINSYSGENTLIYNTG